MTKWHGIAKLMEEMGELQTVLGKLMAYPNGEHPDMRYAPPLLNRLRDELADVLAATQFFIGHNLTGEECEAIEARVAYKTRRLEEWQKNGDGMAGVKVND